MYEISSGRLLLSGCVINNKLRPAGLNFFRYRQSFAVGQTLIKNFDKESLEKKGH